MDSQNQPASISQLNKIGERLRIDVATEDDLKSLDQFRLSFQAAYSEVFAALKQLELNPGGRPQKTTLSIIAKLKREKTRLSRMQDIAGCRIVVKDMMEQDRVIDDIKARWQNALIDDKREKPRYGYRAVHAIVKIGQHLVEIQIRTSVQHGWASAAEKISDIFDPDIKYGGGSEEIQEVLIAASEACARFEKVEYTHAQLLAMFKKLPVEDAKIDEFFRQLGQQDAKFSQVAKLVQVHGGVKNSIDFLEREMKVIRDYVHTMLKKLSEEATIWRRGTA